MYIFHSGRQEAPVWLERDALSLHEASTMCRSKGLQLPAGLSRAARGLVTDHMKRAGLDHAWLAFKRSRTETWRPYNPEALSPPSGTRRCVFITRHGLKATDCLNKISGTVCRLTDCKTCSEWNCLPLADSGCLVILRGIPSWFQARVECQRAGGALWQPGDDWSKTLAALPVPDSGEVEFWVSWHAEDWVLPQTRQNHYPVEYLFRNKHMNSDLNCSALWLTEDGGHEWRPVVCTEKLPVVCVKESLEDHMTRTPTRSPCSVNMGVVWPAAVGGAAFIFFLFGSCVGRFCCGQNTQNRKRKRVNGYEVERFKMDLHDHYSEVDDTLTTTSSFRRVPSNKTSTSSRDMVHEYHYLDTTCLKNPLHSSLKRGHDVQPVYDQAVLPPPPPPFDASEQKQAVTRDPCSCARTHRNDTPGINSVIAFETNPVYSP